MAQPAAQPSINVPLTQEQIAYAHSLLVHAMDRIDWLISIERDESEKEHYRDELTAAGELAESLSNAEAEQAQSY